MTLAPGARLGPYEIVSLLGAGGIGVVYSARDVHLQRTWRGASRSSHRKRRRNRIRRWMPVQTVALDGTVTIASIPIRYSGVNHPFDIARSSDLLTTPNAVHLSTEIWVLEP